MCFKLYCAYDININVRQEGFEEDSRTCQLTLLRIRNDTPATDFIFRFVPYLKNRRVTCIINSLHLIIPNYTITHYFKNYQTLSLMLIIMKHSDNPIILNRLKIEQVR